MTRLEVALYLAAAVTTAVGGILHLMIGPNSLGFNINNGILFIVGGIAQVFWIIPILRKWGTAWIGIGIGGTIVLIMLWVITRFPGNPITGRGGGANTTAILTESFQIAFIALSIAILVYQRKMRKVERNTLTGSLKSKRGVLILTAIVVAIILGGLFVPMFLNQGDGPPRQGPQGQPGGPPPGNNMSPPGSQTDQSNSIATTKSCTLTPSLIEIEGSPQQTEGPYFVDEGLERSDIRSDTSSGKIEEGTTLILQINAYDVNKTGDCVPLEDAKVDIWHANSQGLYSDIFQIGTLGKKYLRGHQMTDENGSVSFTTIYPGWYEGRAIHIHIKIRTFEGEEKRFDWTSQFYLPDMISSEVHMQSPYSNHGQPQVENMDDGIYTGPSTDGLFQSETGKHLMLNLTKTEQGYLGSFSVVVDAIDN
jgi:protocatechuate 3,4-dioxygenase beta subunit